ncbi:hypothetical protein THAOC_34535 [Thalassiosira oceanica]|uniref:Uncharacterized protein n=1 Tax=Thalassiosira oceanica TaxID=159749 RepID=K0RJD8_THAOC|nr:hypothetical protein THAOC_34535 [Thalassiosira oceanica]|eukprot:EJK46782.1 hypothetical protein THAOC_34535 [Thalassiosira oceanica]
MRSRRTATMAAALLLPTAVAFSTSPGSRRISPSIGSSAAERPTGGRGGQTSLAAASHGRDGHSVGSGRASLGGGSGAQAALSTVSLAVALTLSPLLSVDGGAAHAYEESDYASETVTEVVGQLKSNAGDVDKTFGTLEEVAKIITEGKGVGGTLTYGTLIRGKKVKQGGLCLLFRVSPRWKKWALGWNNFGARRVNRVQRIADARDIRLKLPNAESRGRQAKRGRGGGRGHGHLQPRPVPADQLGEGASRFGHRRQPQGRSFRRGRQGVERGQRVRVRLPQVQARSAAHVRDPGLPEDRSLLGRCPLPGGDICAEEREGGVPATKHEPQSKAASIRDVVGQYLLHFGPVSLQILLGELAIALIGWRILIAQSEDVLIESGKGSKLVVELPELADSHRVEFLDGALLDLLPVYRHEPLVCQCLQGHEAKACDERQALSHAFGRHAAAVPNYARDAQLLKERLVLRDEVVVVRVAGPVWIGAVRVGHVFADRFAAASLLNLLLRLPPHRLSSGGTDTPADDTQQLSGEEQ